MLLPPRGGAARGRRAGRRVDRQGRDGHACVDLHAQAAAAAGEVRITRINSCDRIAAQGQGGGLENRLATAIERDRRA